MTARRNPYRRRLATIMTIVVVLLLPIAHLSMKSTVNYEVDYGRDAGTGERPDWNAVSLADFAQRIRVVVGSARGGQPARSVDVMHEDPITHQPSSRSVHVNSKSPRSDRQVAEELAAGLFAIFGLFVLWWGRDRASLWLGLYGASFGVPLFEFYGLLPEWAMLLAKLVADLLEYVGFYALYALAETVALEALAQRDPVRNAIRVAGKIVIAVVGFAAAADLGQLVLPVVFRVPMLDELTWLGDRLGVFCIVVVLCAGPLVLLGLASLRAAGGQPRKKAIVIFLTTLAALSGVITSIVHQHNPPAFEASWFTLLAIPIGFIVTIRAYQVVEVKVVVSRILVVTVMTLIIGALIAVSETIVHGEVQRRIANLFDPSGQARDQIGWVLEFVIAFGIVVSFSNLHHVLDDVFKRLVFRRRDEAVEALHEFAAHKSSSYTARLPLLAHAASLIHRELCTHGTAIYEESENGYDLARECGSWRWPNHVDADDSAFIAMRTERDRADLETFRATPSALGSDGCAFPMTVGGRVIGALIIAPRLREEDGTYVREELAALDDMARGVADALFNLRASETALFVSDVAEGRIGAEEARRRAEALRESGLAGFQGPIRRPAKRSLTPPAIGTTP